MGMHQSCINHASAGTNPISSLLNAFSSLVGNLSSQIPSSFPTSQIPSSLGAITSQIPSSFRTSQIPTSLNSVSDLSSLNGNSNAASLIVGSTLLIVAMIL